MTVSKKTDRSISLEAGDICSALRELMEIVVEPVDDKRSRPADVAEYPPDARVLREATRIHQSADGIGDLGHIVESQGHGKLPHAIRATRRRGMNALVRELQGGPGHRSAALGAVDKISWRTFAGYLDCVAEGHPAVNVAALIGHNTIRATVCGEEESPVSAAELQRMVDEVEIAMNAGALGLSSGLIYAPGRAADVAELGAMAAAAGSRGGLYVTHLRSEAEGLTAAIDEALEIGERANCRVHISHLKAAGRGNWGTMEAVVERLAALPQVTVDVYPYPAASTFLREALAAASEQTPVLPSEVLIASAPDFDTSEGKTLEELATMWGMQAPEAVDHLSGLCPTGVTVVYFVMSETDVEIVLRFDKAMIGSDEGDDRLRWYPERQPVSPAPLRDGPAPVRAICARSRRAEPC